MMWQLENYQTNRVYDGNTFTFAHGDIVMYDLGAKSSNDYSGSGTH